MPRSIDVLTDGSELTEPAIFLTIRRRSLSHNNNGHNHRNRVRVSNGTDSKGKSSRPEISSHGIYYYLPQNDRDDGEDTDEGTVVARYGISGLPSLTGRLASDQSFKLLQGGAFRAVLVPSLVSSFADGTYGMRGATVGGLPSLFLSLVQSGYKVAQPSVSGGRMPAAESSDSALEEGNLPSGNVANSLGGYSDVSIIGPTGVGRHVDGVLDTLFGNLRKRPSICTCEVPVERNWWEVYQDQYVKIWAQTVSDSDCVSICEACSAIKRKHNPGKDESTSTSSDDEDGGIDSESKDVSHATNTGDDAVVFIVALLQAKEGEGERCKRRGKGDRSDARNTASQSFAIMPMTPSLSRSFKCDVCGNCIDKRERAETSLFWRALRTLPQEILPLQRKQRSLLDFILHLDPWTDESNHTPRKGCMNDERSIGRQEPISKRRRIGEVRETTESSTRRVPMHRIIIPRWAFASKLAHVHLATFPDSHLCSCESYGGCSTHDYDEGILIRAQRRSQLLHNALPFAFPLSSAPLNDGSAPRYWRHRQKPAGHITHAGDNEEDKNLYSTENGLSSALAYGLRSCTSLLLHWWNESAGKNAQFSFGFICRMERIHNHHSIDSMGGIIPQKDYTTNLHSVMCAFAGGSCYCNACKYMKLDGTHHAVDENEIDLDGSASDCSISQSERDGAIEAGNERSFIDELFCKGSFDATSPQLLMLGTGCATPSPLRGSSSYGLLFPTSHAVKDTTASVLSAIIECGEGTLTGLLRHLPSYSKKGQSIDIQLSQVKLIWISHSHLDHYGDLPIVVQTIVNAKQSIMTGQNKELDQLVVIAPPKVLKFLHQSTYIPAESKSKIRWPYVALTHRDFEYSPFAGHIRSIIHGFALPVPTFREDHVGEQAERKYYNPFTSLQNVEVEHCRDSFALILQMSVPAKNSSGSSFVLCFSGDTRPSDKLIQGCRLCHLKDTNRGNIGQHPRPTVSLLLHEATFKNDPQGKIDAARKRHCTVIEALDVALHAKVEACMLTHFSQRYKHIFTNDIDQSYPFSWGIALDGMMVPLTNRALAALSRLSCCVDALLKKVVPDG